MHAEAIMSKYRDLNYRLYIQNKQIQDISSYYYWSYCLKYYFLYRILLYKEKKLQQLQIINKSSSTSLQLFRFVIFYNSNILITIEFYC